MKEVDNLVLIRDALRKHPEWLTALNIFKAVDSKGRKHTQEQKHDIGSPTIAKWLNVQGEYIKV